MCNFQQTIKRTIEFSGYGLFSGKEVSLRLKPASVNTGIRFVRTDLYDTPSIQANVNLIANDTRRVFIKKNGAEVESIEHIMSCLSGLGIDNLEIEINGKEMPAGDGSALNFVKLIMEAGLVRQEAERNVFTVRDKILVSAGDASISLIPNGNGNGLTVSYTLDFDGYYLGREEFSIELNPDSFRDQIAPARTFGLISNMAEFRRLDIGKGITDENSLIVHEDGKITKPRSMSPANLRFANECVRHKILDLLGDLYLSNVALNGRVVARRSGHFLNIRMAKKIAEIVSAL